MRVRLRLWTCRSLQDLFLTIVVVAMVSVALTYHLSRNLPPRQPAELNIHFNGRVDIYRTLRGQGQGHDLRDRRGLEGIDLEVKSQGHVKGRGGLPANVISKIHEVLQTVHHTKAYKGSPMKANVLHSLRRQNFISDPRPENFHNKPDYPDHFRNTILNFQIVKITPEERAQIETDTKGQANNKTWRDERTKRLTSSTFGTICKATDRRNLTKVATEMTSTTKVTARALSHGIKYESVAVEAFENKICRTMECGLFVSEKYPWLAASPDRVVDGLSIVEVKCPFSAKDQVISHASVPYLVTSHDKCGLTLDRRHSYYYQIQGQLICSDRHFCYFCVYTLKDFQVFKIERNNKFINEMLVKLNSFFAEHFQPALMNKFVYRFYDKFLG